MEFQKNDMVIVSETYIAKVVMGEGGIPSLFNIGKGSFGKAIAFQDDCTCINFKQIIVDKTVETRTHEDGKCNLPKQYWIPNECLEMEVASDD